MEEIIYSIGFVDTDPDTGEKYPFKTICWTTSDTSANWIASTLTRDLWEHADNPNREIIIKSNVDDLG